jgi:very-short-patch-repair endonuclease
MSIAELVDQLGGFAQKRQLVRRGARDHHLTLAVRDGTVTRARQGWYTTLPEHDNRVKAVRVGGRLTGISAIIGLGGWVLGDFPLHVSVPVNAARLRNPVDRRRKLNPPRAGVVLHWDDADVVGRGAAAIVGLEDALVEVVKTENFETAIAALDWAMHTDRVDEFDYDRIMKRVPPRQRIARKWVDAECEALPESLARTRLKLAGHEVESQERLPSDKRIDLVIDGIIGLETDGKEHHADAFEPDRLKDVEITLSGFHAMRFSANMVFHHWDMCLRAVEAALAARNAPARSGNSGDRARKPPKLRPKRPNRAPVPEFPKASGNGGPPEGVGAGAGTGPGGMHALKVGEST